MRGGYCTGAVCLSLDHEDLPSELSGMDAMSQSDPSSGPDNSQERSVARPSITSSIALRMSPDRNNDYVSSLQVSDECS